MTTKYYRSNNSDWNTNANWSTSSGGAADTTFPTAGDDVIFDDNSGNCTLDAAAACDKITIGTVGALYTGTLDGNGQTVTIGTGGLDCTYGGSAAIDLGGGKWTCSGDWDHRDVGTFTHSNSEIELDGTSKTYHKTGVSKNPYSLTISGTISAIGDTTERTYGVLSVTGTLTIGGVISSRGTTAVSGSGTITSGTLDCRGNITNQQGVISVANLLFNHSAISIAAGTYAATNVKFYNERVSLSTYTFAGAVIFTGTVTLGSGHTRNIVFANNTNNPDITLRGNLAMNMGTGTLTWNKGGGTITFNLAANQDIDFDGHSVEDIAIDKDTAGLVTMTGDVQTVSFTGTACAGGFDPNGKTITVDNNCSWAAAFDFDSAADCCNGCSWVVDGNFTANGQSLKATAGWSLEVALTAVASGAGDVAHSDANGMHTEIDASAGPWTDNGNNTNWSFGAVEHAKTIQIGPGLTNATKYALSP